MSIAGLALDASKKMPIVLLRDPSGRRQVPIWIDHAQAHNIMAGFHHRESPITHDLMISILKAGNLHLDRVVIPAIEKGTFQAILQLKVIKKKGEQPDAKKSPCKDTNKLIEIDARPSDAIALAVRSKCSIWMLEEVVAEASIPVDADADLEDQHEFRRFLETTSPASLIKHLKTRDSSYKDLDLPNSDSE